MNGKLLFTNVYQNTFLENIGWHSMFYCKTCGEIPTDKKQSLGPQTPSKLCKIAILLLFCLFIFNVANGKETYGKQQALLWS